MSKFAIVFPGQGSQAVGMLADLAEQYAVVKQTFAEASEVLGYDLWA
ncbi:ACP S-malonyltransferase, partial [Vibrio cholerae]|nr:ACP S-malonyltransferase [Vibrio cholerae]